MVRLALFLCAVACSAARPPSTPACAGPISCAREQLVEADDGLRRAIQKRGVTEAFAGVLMEEAKLLGEGRGLVSGKQGALDALQGVEPFTWTLARADVSLDAGLGYSFGWLPNGHYVAIWRRQGGDWKLAVFLRKPAAPQDLTPPAWFVPFRGEPGAVPPAAQTVAAADTAFAALAKRSGTQSAFTTYAAQDAVQLSRTMIFGREAIGHLFDDGPAIDWAPLVEDAAQDLGYTIGAFTAGAVRGNYLTIWRLQPDGEWRYVLDGGVRA